MMRLEYRPRGVCSQRIEIDVEDGCVQDVKFTGGCSGNLQGISRLVKGMPVEEVISRVEGIRCGFKPTSCPDQLAQALKQFRDAPQDYAAYPASAALPAAVRLRPSGACSCGSPGGAAAAEPASAGAKAAL